MPKFYIAPAALPIEPMKRLQSDGRVISVLPLYRHEIPMPPLVYPEHSWKADPRHGWNTLWGHPEVGLLLDRTEAFLDAIHADDAGRIKATKKDIFLLRALQSNVETVLHPVRKIIASECSPAFLLPVDGRWLTYGDCVREYRAPDLDAARNAVRFIHTATGWLDVMEQRLALRLAEAQGAA